MKKYSAGHRKAQDSRRPGMCVSTGHEAHKMKVMGPTEEVACGKKDLRRPVSMRFPAPRTRVLRKIRADREIKTFSESLCLVIAWMFWLFVWFLPAGCGTGGITGQADVGEGTGNGGIPSGGGGSGNWEIRTVDSNGDAGHLNSLAFGIQGTPRISYFAYMDGSYWIRYAFYDGWSWDVETIFQTDTKTGCPLTIDPAGNPVMTFVGGESQPLYYWPFQSDLILAQRTGEAWEQQTVDEENVVGLWSSVAFDRFGRPGISYQDLGDGIDYNNFHMRDLKYAYFSGSAWEIETVEKDGGGYYTDLLFDDEGHPAIAFCGNLDEYTQPVKFALRGDYGWEIHTVDAAEECAEGSLSARKRPLGGFGIAYYDNRNQDLKYASYFGGFWHVETVEAHNKVGKYCSLDYNEHGEPVISYYYCGRSTDTNCQAGGDLRVARRTQTGWETETVDSEGNTGLFTSLEVTDQGDIYIAYYDNTAGALKVAVQRPEN